VAADANPKGTEFARAKRVLLQVGDDRGGVGVVRGQGFVDLAPVAAVCSLGVVGENFSEGFKFMKNLRHSDKEALGGEESRGAAYGARDMKDL
jgi:hypothetical protein